MPTVRLPRPMIVGGVYYGAGIRCVSSVISAALIARGATHIDDAQPAPAPTSMPAISSSASATDDYTQLFTAEQLTWTVNHNLGRYPIVVVMNLAGHEIESEVQHVSTNLLRVIFVIPTAGRIRCS